MKRIDGQIFNLVQSSTQARLAQHSRHEGGLLEKGASQFKIVPEVKRSRKRGSNNFGIRKLAPLVILMANSFEQVVRDTVERDNIVYYDPLLNSIGVGSEGIFSFSKSFANSQLATWIN